VLGVAVAGFAATRTGTETKAKCTTASGEVSGSLVYTDAQRRERLTTWRHYHPALARWIDDHRTLARDAADHYYVSFWFRLQPAIRTHFVERRQLAAFRLWHSIASDARGPRPCRPGTPTTTVPTTTTPTSTTTTTTPPTTTTPDHHAAGDHHGDDHPSGDHHDDDHPADDHDDDHAAVIERSDGRGLGAASVRRVLPRRRGP
jgi:hypothetical protein